MSGTTTKEEALGKQEGDCALSDCVLLAGEKADKERTHRLRWGFEVRFTVFVSSITEANWTMMNDPGTTTDYTGGQLPSNFSAVCTRRII